MGVYQPKFVEYPRTKYGSQTQHRRFQYSWFDKFRWLEYSPEKDAVFCFPCFIFENKSPCHAAFTTDGFNCWKRVNDGVRCPFLIHVGTPTSPHSNVVQNCEELMKVTGRIDKVLNAQSLEEVQKNRLKLKASIESLQACAFRGHDDAPTSSNRGNFIEMVKFCGRMNDDISDIVLERASENAKYTSPTIQKEILHIFANRVRRKIREEVGDSKFCILVDEAKDSSNKEDMSIILRFVDRLGILRERFFEIIHVPNTTAATLKEKIPIVLSRYNLHSSDMRGQGYDGASNMSGERDTGRGINQIGNLHRSGSTRWSSHFDSICSLIDMYGATISVLGSIVEEGNSTSLRGEATGCLIIMRSFEFIFTLHMMHKIMGVTDLLCRALQHKSLDIVSAMDLVSTTKALLLTLREEGFDHLLVYETANVFLCWHVGVSPVLLLLLIATAVLLVLFCYYCCSILLITSKLSVHLITCYKFISLGEIIFLSPPLHLTEYLLKENPSLCEHMAPSLDARQEIVVTEVPKLGKRAATKALEEWGQPLYKITHLIFCTSTGGVDMPGADFRLTKLLGLCPSVKRYMIYQQGCFAGGTVLRLAKDLAENNKGARVLVVCSEIMVFTFQGPNETNLGSLISQALFGDGAGAVIVGSDPITGIEKPLFEIASAAQTIVPDSDGAIDGHYREVGITLHLVKEVLRDYRNMSSACVLFILDEMRKGSAKDGKRTTGEGLDWGVLFGFGPGLTIETVVLHSVLI
ncbi:hypothetical protein POM88_047138 [Heracleum sosnowskyi]|uniref:TTF-type domain-containing protein n=1 Tax=Heracleum sosnowskyi TaxID=360622 RepID=A0AAD8H8T2_9APIA|nr:hypothetical protein POM88_047138 [Heracleum sosnowskyi]